MARSPRYPQLSLEEAIERVGKVYRAERTHKVEKKAVAKDLGYGSLNGASTSLISTLKSYGLLAEDKEGVNVTEDAVTLLRAPEDDPEKAGVLRRAAFTPKVFAELREAYGDDPDELPSETTLTYRLEKRGFLERAASDVIRVYRDNIELVSKSDAEYTEAEPVEELPVEAPMQPQTTVEAPPGPIQTFRVDPPAPAAPPRSYALADQQAAFTESLEIRISGNSKVRLLFDGVVTKEAIGKLVKYLELAEDDYPSKEDLEHPVAEQPVAIEMPEPE